jgi:hypothetical protein
MKFIGLRNTDPGKFIGLRNKSLLGHPTGVYWVSEQKTAESAMNTEKPQHPIRDMFNQRYFLIKERSNKKSFAGFCDSFAGGEQT